MDKQTTIKTGANAMRDLVKPVPMLHGTNTSSLVHQILEVKLALEQVALRLADALPHGRDYADAEQWIAARNAWHDRRVAIGAMITEFELHAYEILGRDEAKNYITSRSDEERSIIKPDNELPPHRRDHL
jgi:hypothetical protein